MNPLSHTEPPSSIWIKYLDPKESAKIMHSGFARRAGFGERPALLLIDVQRYMVGDASLGESEIDTYPSSCGSAGRAALEVNTALLAAARRARIPTIFTKFVLAPDGSDAGTYRLKRTIVNSDWWCLEGTPGSELCSELAVAPGEQVLIKKKPSAFVGTPLLQLLIDKGVDSVIVTGGSTSNCVRATCVDAAALNLKVVVPADAVFDRVAASHAISLFDLDRQYGDVVWSEDVINYLDTLEPRK